MVYKLPICFLSVGIVGCCCGLFLVPYIFHVVLKDIVTKIMVISPSSQIYDAWKNADVPIVENFYFFEVLNPEDALNGLKPQLKERGPYAYRITMPKVNISFFENKTVSFQNRYTYTFDESLSAGPENDTFMMINIPVATMVTMLEDLPRFIKASMSLTLKELGEEMFVEMSPKKLMWGYEDALFKFIRSITGDLFIPSDIFGLFIGRNNTGVGMFNIETGERNKSEVNNINTWKYMKELPWWLGYAKMINGTDGFMYHSFLSKDETLYLFNADLCRSVSYKYKRDTQLSGVPLWLFALDHFTYANSTIYPPNAEFCSENCPPSGTFPVAKCRDNSPISISNPHFLDGTEQLQNSVGGLHPNEKYHLNFLSLENIMGMPFELAIRIQLNIQTIKSSSIKQTGNIQTLQFPILWFEEIVTVDNDTVKQYNDGIGLALTCSNVVKYVMTGISALLVMIAVIIFTRKERLTKKMKAETKSVQTTEKTPLLN
ncbi:scavenger receptor class B member 1-like [Antedon mediterranea]|uniref:scavenger receptor class B member 1-like n=1 Tax=Antedon mediterranea TaxID=105859 RepID=UPI003AF58489